MRKQDFEFLVNLLRENAGWNFDEEQYFVIDKKMSSFIREKGFASVEDLVEELKLGSRPLIAQVVESLALSDTSFYRDYDVFSRFENSMLPLLRENNRATKKLRFWSLGCSTGQETYSMAMCIKNKFLGLDEWDIDILGTDISGVAIAKAQRGIYNNFETQMGLNIKTILQYFHKDGDNWQVNDDIRSMVEFRRYNMLDDITFTDKFEVIFCRNVLRFFTEDNQRKILAKLSLHQPFGGILYLGKNEQIPCIGEFYQKVSGYNCVYESRGLEDAKPKPGIKPEELLHYDEDDDLPSFSRPKGLFGHRPFASEAFKR